MTESERPYGLGRFSWVSAGGDRAEGDIVYRVHSIDPLYWVKYLLVV